MSSIELCPVCGDDLAHAQHFAGTTICGCGWTHSEVRQKAESKSSKGPAIGLGALGALILGLMIHISNWDHFSLEIIPLKAKQMMGSVENTELARIVEICEARKKPGCVEQAYFELHIKLPKNKGVLQSLAKVQVANGNLDGAVKSYDKYFKLKGMDLEMIHGMATTLAKLEQADRAEKFYKWAIQRSKYRPDAPLVRDYVSMLMDGGEYLQARKQINSFRRKNKHGALFLEKELRQINKKLKFARL